ncbi:MAG TPA: hypothetical protein VFN95_10065 [Flavitalea sp.]|nr:hypothetical protein [Flavitalea sp.]
MIKVRWDINQTISENNTDAKFFHSDDLYDNFRLYVTPPFASLRDPSYLGMTARGIQYSINVERG